MKKTLLLVSTAVAAALTLSGCAEVKSVYEAVAGPSHSDKLTIDGEVETPTGPYASIRVSDDYINSVYAEAGGNFVSVLHRDDPALGTRDYFPSNARGTIVRYFFNDWIDSIALEGGSEEFTTWKAEVLTQGKLSSAPTTLGWLNGERGGEDQWGVLGEANLFGTARSSTLIHDGKPRIADADIHFGEVSWFETDDATVTLVETEWSVNYRVSEEVAREIARSQANTTDEQWTVFLEDEPEHGDGETLIRVEGTATWWLSEEMTGGTDAPIYFIDYQAHPSITR